MDTFLLLLLWFYDLFYKEILDSFILPFNSYNKIPSKYFHFEDEEIDLEKSSNELIVTP